MVSGISGEFLVESGGCVMGYGRAGRPKNSERAYRPTAEAVDAERAMRKACAFYSSFRDDGPLRRDLYPKHVAFMAAGREWKQRAFLAANRCLTYESKVSTLQGEISVGELFDRGLPFDVWAWDEKAEKKVVARAGVPFRKPQQAECYRLTMSDGRWFECSSEHTILTASGWQPFSSVLRGYVDSIQESSGACSPSGAGPCAPRSSGSADVPQGVVSRLLRRTCDGDVGNLPLALSSPSNSVVSVSTVGRQYVYDFEVETYHNYLAAGICHHNSGKTTVAAYELVCHATGSYPDFWTGRRFDKPVDIWVAGDTAGTARDILQTALLGPTSTIETREWSGMIPRTMVYDVSRKPGVPLAVSSIWVRHTTGGVSTIEVKSFDQKRESFQGTTKAMCWLDEEPPEDIYGECLMRTMTSDGLMLVTFTPLQGLTPFIASWLEQSVVEVLDERGHSELRPAKSEVFKGIEVADLPDESDFKGAEAPKEEKGTRYIVMASWDDAPHLTREQKDAMLLEFPIHQRDARSKGIPALGSGVIYPIPEGDIRVAPFEVPDSWPRAYALDIDAGAGWTAALWGAHDRTSNVYYIYDCYKRSHAEPVIHAEAIKARGKWIPGVADAAALLVTAGDVEQMLSVYRRLGLDIVLPKKGVEAAIFQVWELLSAGRLKVFASCEAFFEEFRLYRRDGKGRIVKQHDHLCDCLSYLVVTGFPRAKTKPVKDDPMHDRGLSFEARALSWLS